MSRERAGGRSVAADREGPDDDTSVFEPAHGRPDTEVSSSGGAGTHAPGVPAVPLGGDGLRGAMDRRRRC